MKDEPKTSKKQGSRRSGNHGNEPPARYRFRPGQPGNPRGRPKGRRNLATIFRDLLALPAGKLGMDADLPPGATVADALAAQAVKLAYEGNPRYLAFIAERADGKVTDKAKIELWHSTRAIDEASRYVTNVAARRAKIASLGSERRCVGRNRVSSLAGGQNHH